MRALGTTALVAGALLLAPILVNALTSLLGGRVMDRFGGWPLLPVGFALIVAGQFVVSLAGGRSLIVAVVAASVVVYADVGLVMTPP